MQISVSVESTGDADSEGGMEGEFTGTRGGSDSGARDAGAVSPLAGVEGRTAGDSSAGGCEEGTGDSPAGAGDSPTGAGDEGIVDSAGVAEGGTVDSSAGEEEGAGVVPEFGGGVAPLKISLLGS